MKQQIIKTVHESDQIKFEQAVNNLTGQGYRISSTSCGFVQSERYDFCDVYHAILVKETFVDTDGRDDRIKNLEYLKDYCHQE